MPRVKSWTQVRPNLFKGELDTLPPSKRNFTYRGKKLPIDVNLLTKAAKGLVIPEGTSAIAIEGSKPYVYIYSAYTEPVDLNAWDVGEGILPGNVPNWFAANGWANGSPFNNGWRDVNVDLTNGILSLILNDTPASGFPYSSGEYRTSDFYHYGRYECQMKPTAGSGTMNGFFTYTGPSDGNVHDEIDIEIAGSNPRTLRTNYWRKGVPHEQFFDLGFDSSLAFHTYAFEWLKDSITWFVNGKQFRRATVDIPVTPSRLMVNLWPGDASASPWLGTFNYTQPLSAQFTNFFFYPDTPTTGGLKNESEFILVDESRNPLS